MASRKIWLKSNFLRPAVARLRESAGKQKLHGGVEFKRGSGVAVGRLEHCWASQHWNPRGEGDGGGGEEEVGEAEADGGLAAEEDV